MYMRSQARCGIVITIDAQILRFGPGGLADSCFYFAADKECPHSIYLNKHG